MNVLIAGGRGLIGSEVSMLLRSRGHQVKVLSRNPSKVDEIYWNPLTGEIDEKELRDIEVLIHLAGTGIADRNWTKNRKKELLDSRIKPIEFLWNQRDNMPSLKYSVSISGITCYGTKHRKNPYTEEDGFGSGFIDELVHQWEDAALKFSERVPVGILRMGVVLSDRGGMIERLTNPMRFGLGAVIGKGTQFISWIHIEDVAAVFAHAIDTQLNGKFNVLTGNCTNSELTYLLAEKMGSKIRLPRIPSFLMKLYFGEMSTLLVEGVEASNEKLMHTGYTYIHPGLNGAVHSLNIKRRNTRANH